MNKNAVEECPATEDAAPGLVQDHPHITVSLGGGIDVIPVVT